MTRDDGSKRSSTHDDSLVQVLSHVVDSRLALLEPWATVVYYTRTWCTNALTRPRVANEPLVVGRERATEQERLLPLFPTRGASEMLAVDAVHSQPCIPVFLDTPYIAATGSTSLHHISKDSVAGFCCCCCCCIGVSCGIHVRSAGVCEHDACEPATGPTTMPQAGG